MKLSEYIKAARGNATALAAVLDVHKTQISNWAGDSPPPAPRCIDIELATEGAVTVEELNPALRWVRKATDGWPHPDGRPLLDLAKADQGA